MRINISYFVLAVAFILAGCQEENIPEPEQVGGIGESSTVCPAFTAMPTFPICTDGREDFIGCDFESVRILCDRWSDDINEGVHFSVTHTFHSRSSLSRRFTVFASPSI